MNPADQLPLFADDPRGARDQAFTRVLDNAGEEWVNQGLAFMRLYARARPEFIAEEFRIWAIASGLSPPHHHNGWGALVAIACRRQLIAVTSHTRQMRTEKSHARRSPVLRWIAAP